MSQMVRGLRKGYVWNPLMKWKRNSACMCGSGKKFKNCHLRLLPSAITTEMLAKLRGK